VRRHFGRVHHAAHPQRVRATERRQRRHRQRRGPRQI
jgi:hypothetical protein